MKKDNIYAKTVVDEVNSYRANVVLGERTPPIAPEEIGRPEQFWLNNDPADVDASTPTEHRLIPTCVRIVTWDHTTHVICLTTQPNNSTRRSFWIWIFIGNKHTKCGNNGGGSNSGSPSHYLPPGHSPTPSSTPVSELSPDTI
ncbi:uncharacterized protein LOC106095763 [Stomoxys calcitrans]|uniref:uncharacterized protein LOC106095763 n=1 Tax=Stomoxys calcitrans TaxID=35570 RepID=UPI0027E28108|nr:uncharacterized protein LOC106095763 [Stomoxys calcitrans]